jgi:hypothetical protein
VAPRPSIGGHEATASDRLGVDARAPRARPRGAELRVDLDALGAPRPAPRRGDHDPAVAAAEVVHDVPRTDLREVEHRRHDRVRRLDEVDVRSAPHGERGADRDDGRGADDEGARDAHGGADPGTLRRRFVAPALRVHVLRFER